MNGLFPGCSGLDITLDVSSELDLSDASAARIKLRLPSDAVLTFDATLSSVTASSCVVSYTTVAEDLAAGTEGSARVWAEVDLPGTTLVSGSHAIQILAVGR